jgi:hypothetical protein
MKRMHLVGAAIGLFLFCIAGSVRADGGYIDPALTEQNSYCWDSTFQVWIQCSPIVWSTNPDPNAGGGGSSSQCPKVNSYDTCVSNCDCVWRNNKSKCGTNLTCLDLANSEHDACLGGCLTDWT